MAALPVAAVDRTWTGLGATNNWSEAANWSDNSVPGASDRAIFNATGTKNVTIDTDISVQGILIEAGYTGTITQGTSNVTVGNGNYSQAAGTFLGGSGPISFTDNTFRLLGGTFTASSSTTSFTFSFTKLGGTFNHNNGTVVFFGPVTVISDKEGRFLFEGLSIGSTYILSVRSEGVVIADPIRVIVLDSGTVTVEFEMDVVPGKEAPDKRQKVREVN